MLMVSVVLWMTVGYHVALIKGTHIIISVCSYIHTIFIAFNNCSEKCNLLCLKTRDSLIISSFTITMVTLGCITVSCLQGIKGNGYYKQALRHNMQFFLQHLNSKKPCFVHLT